MYIFCSIGVDRFLSLDIPLFNNYTSPVFYEIIVFVDTLKKYYEQITDEIPFHFLIY